MATFYCKLRDCPEIPVKAPDKYAAQEAYKQFCGVIATIHKIEILAETEMVGDKLVQRKADADKLVVEKKWSCKA